MLCVFQVENRLKESEAGLVEAQEKYEGLQKMQSEEETVQVTQKEELEAKITKQAKDISNLEVGIIL